MKYSSNINGDTYLPLYYTPYNIAEHLKREISIKKVCCA